ncbi:phenylacetic acid degradation protein [Alicyclobacillus fastidiosus]|uniref:Phenylacetic acid degradation protein n=1 Tax=Alicyclobacillus fastidiosus TaxID=392011 RepID=A0ABV5AAN5_9BACL|nr:phenylacetic acid degradation protein [Alicyclobacillus fastidiosus]WEH11900.1 phenylacetic acid degradation protein [Alicyclobacillus fastidiosus]
MTEEQARHCYVPYEVFIQKSKLDYHVYVGSVLAPSPELALQLARENFLRRDTAVNIWVVRQSDIHKTRSEDDAFFAREFSRDYREVTGYSANARRWKAFKKARAGEHEG